MTPKTVQENLATSVKDECKCCGKNHRIYRCDIFKNLSIKIRSQLIKVKQLCFNCFRPGHQSEDCSGSRCKEGGQKHNTLHHCEQKNVVKKPDNATQQTSAKVKTDDKNFTGEATHEKSQDKFFLQTAIIPLEINGELFHVRGVLDSASQNNLITEAAAQHLQVRRRNQTTRICGVRENEVCDIKGQVHLLIRPSDNEPISITALILQKLTNILPSRQINIDNWKKVKELQLADPRLNDPQEIDTIIGAAHYENLMIGNNKNKEQTGSIFFIGSQFWLACNWTTKQQQRTYFTTTDVSCQ